MFYKGVCAILAVILATLIVQIRVHYAIRIAQLAQILRLIVVVVFRVWYCRDPLVKQAVIISFIIVLVHV